MNKHITAILIILAWINAILCALDFPVWLTAGIYWALISVYWMNKRGE